MPRSSSSRVSASVPLRSDEAISSKACRPTTDGRDFRDQLLLTTAGFWTGRFRFLGRASAASESDRRIAPLTQLTETVAAAPSSGFATGRQKLAAHLAMLVFAGLVAGSYSIGAMAAPHVGPAAINAMRFAVGVAVMAGVALIILRGRIPAPRAVWRYAVLGGLMAVFFVTMFIALRLTDPVSAGAVFTLMPLMAAFFGWLF